MPAFIHILVVLLAIAGAACGKDPARGPDAQQLARINKELAILDAKVQALSKRLDRLEHARQQPESQNTNSNAPPTTAVPPGDQPAPSPPTAPAQ